MPIRRTPLHGHFVFWAATWLRPTTIAALLLAMPGLSAAQVPDSLAHDSSTSVPSRPGEALNIKVKQSRLPSWLFREQNPVQSLPRSEITLRALIGKHPEYAFYYIRRSLAPPDHGRPLSANKQSPNLQSLLSIPTLANYDRLTLSARRKQQLPDNAPPNAPFIPQLDLISTIAWIIGLFK